MIQETGLPFDNHYEPFAPSPEDAAVCFRGDAVLLAEQNGITVSMKCSVSSISQNKISKIKNNGISLSQDARVYWVLKNKIKNCGKSTVYDGLKVKAKRK